MPGVLQTSTLADKAAGYCENHTVVPRILEKQQFNHNFFPLVFDFGTEFFSDENYAKHLVQTLLLGKYANSLSVACQGQGEEGQGQVLVEDSAQNPFSIGRSQLREASGSRTWTEQLQVHSQLWACPGPVPAGPPGPPDQTSLSFRVGTHWCFLPQGKHTEVT